MLPSPLLPPRTAIVFRIRIIDVGGKALDGVSEDGEERCFGIPGKRSVRVRVEGKGTRLTMGQG